MFRPELRSQVGKEQKETFGEAFMMLKRAIDRCQREGLAPPGDPTRLVLVAWSAVHGASALWIDGSLHHAELVQNGEALAAMVAGTVVELFASGGTDDGRRAAR